jgi:ATP-dependent DNA ligase
LSRIRTSASGTTRVFQALTIYVEARSQAFFENVCKMDLEGIVAKREPAIYRPTRKALPYWGKIKNPKYSQVEGRDGLFDHP